MKRLFGRSILGALVLAGLTLNVTHAENSRPIRNAERVIYSFHQSHGEFDGTLPKGTPFFIASGDVLGTTLYGGYPGEQGCGTVFELFRQNDGGFHESVLHRFSDNASDGCFPNGSLVGDGSGALFGTTFQGGNLGCQFNGCGAIFKLTPRAGGYTESIVYSFGGGVDGRLPLGSLISDGRQDFFGTTQAAGGRSGYGTVFELVPARASMTGYVLHTLYAFKGKPGDGNAPQGAVVADPLGNLYGTTAFGGASNQWGTIFRLSPDASGYHETILHSFSGGSDGSMPATALVLGPNGTLFGTTPVGGSASGYQGNGVVFMLSPIARGAYTYRTIHTFEGLEGYPGQLTLGGDGALYGTTRMGAGLMTGCVFRLKPTQLGFTYEIIYRFGALPDAEGPEGGVVFGPHGDLYGTSAGGGVKGDGAVFQLSLKRS